VIFHGAVRGHHAAPQHVEARTIDDKRRHMVKTSCKRPRHPKLTGDDTSICRRNARSRKLRSPARYVNRKLGDLEPRWRHEWRHTAPEWRKRWRSGGLQAHH